jgi:hypothetical protein
MLEIGDPGVIALADEFNINGRQAAACRADVTVPGRTGPVRARHELAES